MKQKLAICILILSSGLVLSSCGKKNDKNESDGLNDKAKNYAYEYIYLNSNKLSHTFKSYAAGYGSGDWYEIPSAIGIISGSMEGKTIVIDFGDTADTHCSYARTGVEIDLAPLQVCTSGKKAGDKLNWYISSSIMRAYTLDKITNVTVLFAAKAYTPSRL